jgi:hypothetical protein
MRARTTIAIAIAALLLRSATRPRPRSRRRNVRPKGNNMPVTFEDAEIRLGISFLGKICRVLAEDNAAAHVKTQGLLQKVIDLLQLQEKDQQTMGTNIKQQLTDLKNDLAQETTVVASVSTFIHRRPRRPRRGREGQHPGPHRSDRPEHPGGHRAERTPAHADRGAAPGPRDRPGSPGSARGSGERRPGRPHRLTRPGTA